MALLQLKLKKVPGVVGIYGKTKDQFPASMSMLHPEAAAAYADAIKAVGPLKVSDMYRSAEQSLAACREKTGVMPPGWSAHNYGLAIDIDVDFILKATKRDKPTLDRAMLSAGWWCHRKDGRRGMEDWHYTYFGVGKAAQPFLDVAEDDRTIQKATEAKIVATYGDELKLDPFEAQAALKKLGFYSGAIDGVIGPRGKEALSAFQRAWCLTENGKLDVKTERTLALVSADKIIID